MRTFLNFWMELKFYGRLVLACVVLQQLFHLLLGDSQVPFGGQVLLYWAIGSATFYAFGYLVEEVIKKDPRLRAMLDVRETAVKPQPVPPFTARGIVRGELKAIVMAAAVLYMAPEVHRSNDLLGNAGWFLMQIAAADFGAPPQHPGPGPRA